MANGKKQLVGGLLEEEAVGFIKSVEEFARQIVYLLVGFQIVNWSDSQTGLVLSAASGLLAIFSSVFIRKLVFSQKTVAEQYTRKKAA